MGVPEHDPFSRMSRREALAFVGAVVGATHPNELKALRERLPHVWFLVPGYGAQGGNAADVRAALARGGVA